MKFAFPEDVRFSCQQCGDCCRGWEVALSEDEVARLSSLDWRGIDAAPNSDYPIAHLDEGRHGWSVLARRGEGACVFLSAENQCLIHQHFGEPAKPLMCRLYPFSFHQVADTLGVDVAYSCRSVAERSGEPLEARRSEWLRLLELNAVTPLQARFNDRYELNGDVLWEIEHHLIRILEDSSRSLLRRLWMIHEFARLALVGAPAAPTATALRRAIAATLGAQLDQRQPPDSMDRTELAIVMQWFYLLLNPIPVGFFDKSQRERTSWLQARDRQARAAVGGDNVFVDNEPLGLSVAEVRQLGPGVLVDGDTDRSLGRYLAAKIIGQRFLYAGDTLLSFDEALPRWLLTYASIAFASRAVAGQRGDSSVQAQDVRHAVRLVDRSIGRLSLERLNKAQRKAWQFVLQETDAPISAAVYFLAAEPPK